MPTGLCGAALGIPTVFAVPGGLVQDVPTVAFAMRAVLSVVVAFLAQGVCVTDPSVLAVFGLGCSFVWLSSCFSVVFACAVMLHILLDFLPDESEKLPILARLLNPQLQPALILGLLTMNAPEQLPPTLGSQIPKHPAGLRGPVAPLIFPSWTFELSRSLSQCFLLMPLQKMPPE